MANSREAYLQDLYGRAALLQARSGLPQPGKAVGAASWSQSGAGLHGQPGSWDLPTAAGGLGT